MGRETTPEVPKRYAPLTDPGPQQDGSDEAEEVDKTRYEAAGAGPPGRRSAVLRTELSRDHGGRYLRRARCRQGRLLLVLRIERGALLRVAARVAAQPTASAGTCHRERRGPRDASRAGHQGFDRVLPREPRGTGADPHRRPVRGIPGERSERAVDRRRRRRDPYQGGP